MMSEPLSLHSNDIKRVAVGGLICIVGAGATYLEQSIPTIDFGQWTPLIVAVNSMIINMLRKWVCDTNFKDPDYPYKLRIEDWPGEEDD